MQMCCEFIKVVSQQDFFYEAVLPLVFKISSEIQIFLWRTFEMDG